MVKKKVKSKDDNILVQGEYFKVKKPYTIEETRRLIEEQVEKTCKGLSDEEKKMQLDALTKVFIEGQSPKEAMGIDESVMTIAYTKAYSLYNAGQYSESGDLFKVLVHFDPSNAKYHMGLAACYHLMGEYDLAITIYFITYLCDKTSPIPFFHMSDCFMKLEDLPSAYVALGYCANVSGSDPQYATLKTRCEKMMETIRIQLGQQEEVSPEDTEFFQQYKKSMQEDSSGSA